MSSPNNKPQEDPQLPSAVMPSTPSRPISLDNSAASQDNDNMSPRSTPVNSTGSNFSPADCRTLQKILHDVRSPSPISTTSYFSTKPASRLNLNATPAGSISEEQVIHEEKEFDHGNEHEAGYEDENDSMELSDGEDAFGVDGQYDADTIEDVMNLPGRIASSVPVHDYSNHYAHDQPMSDGAEELQLRRASIERDLKEQCQQQELAPMVATTDGVFDTDARVHGVSRLTLAVHGVGDLKPLHEDIGMRPVEDEEAVVNTLGSLETYTDQPQPSLTSSNARRASEATLPVSTSFIAFPSPARAVVQTPNGKHIDFAPFATTPNTPLATTLGYIQSQESKDSSPLRSYHNTSSPEGIAKLARDTRVKEEEAAEEKELAKLDRFRDMDLAPIETVMQGGPAGDLIMSGTPVKAKDEALFLQSASETADSEVEDWVDLQRPQPGLSPSRHPASLIEQDEENDADAEESDTLSDPDQKQLARLPQQPAFITVIIMLPAAMFWATVASLVHYSTKAFDMLIEGLTGLKVE